MCRVPVQLRESVKQRLAAAAEEIFELLERTIAEYEEELVFKYEQQRRQGALYTQGCDAPLEAAESNLRELPQLKQHPEAPPHLKQHPEAPPPFKHPEAPPLFKQHPEAPPPFKQHPESPPHLKQHPEAPPPFKQHPEAPLPFKQHPESPPHLKQHPESPPPFKQHPEDPPPFKQHSEDPPHLKQEQEALDVTARVCEEVKMEEQLSDFEASGVFPLPDQQEALSHSAWTEVSLDVDSDPADCAGPLSPPGGAKGRKRRIHECPLCCLRFQSSFNLETHLRVHTGERPFSCSVCGKTFNRKDSLNNHHKIHAGETFCCGECGKRYSDKSNLRRHVLSTHGIRESRPVHERR